MSRRSRKHRKRFSCGHRGFGQYCHRCAQQQRLTEQLTDSRHKRLQQRQQQKLAWQQTFEDDAVDLRRLPKPVILKAREILSQLANGTPYWQLAGRRLQSARWIIRIPVTRRYRLLCRDDGDGPMPIRVVSHEDYNLLVNRVHRWFG